MIIPEIPMIHVIDKAEDLISLECPQGGIQIIIGKQEHTIPDYVIKNKYEIRSSYSVTVSDLASVEINKFQMTSFNVAREVGYRFNVGDMYFDFDYVVRVPDEKQRQAVESFISAFIRSNYQEWSQSSQR